MKAEEDLNKLFFGSDASEKLKKFKNGMLDIEKKYSDNFENRISKINPENQDRLHNHYAMVTNSNGITFGFTGDSDLDNNIKVECHALFNSIFNSKN